MFSLKEKKPVYNSFKLIVFYSLILLDNYIRLIVEL